MKNLFKNLMLVAVAAMAFTACQNDNNEVNEVAKKTVISGVLSFDEETRSGFVGTETTDNGDGTTTTVYKSAWDGSETIKLFADNGLETTATVDEKGKFTAQFDGELPEKFFMTIVSPAESWSSQYNSTIPAEQTPRANSVDPLAHILKAQNVYVTNGSADAANMDHQVAYGKMTVNGVDFAIDHVVVDLKGSFSGYARECSYTVKANGVDNTFWFATEPIDVAEFTVTAYDAEGYAVAKTVSMEGKEKPLAFSYGRVSTFSVSGLEEPVAFTRAYVDEYASSTSDYVIWFEGPAGKLKTNPCNITTEDWALIPGTYNVQTGGQCFYNGSWTALNGLSSDSGTVTVSVVNGMYHFDFNIIHTNGSVFTGSYTGLVEGLNIPDSRTQLAAPTATATADGNVITISWNGVTGADEYYVSCTNGGLDAITTTDTSVTIEAEYSTKYDFSIKAVAHDSNPDYKTSGVYNFSVTTGKDPNAVIPEFTTIKYLRQEVTYASYGEYCHVFELTNSDNYKMELYVHSSQSSSTHIAEGEYHFETKMNLGYANMPWGFQAKVWNADGSYLGLTSQNSVMVVSKSGDIYNIDFTLIMDGKTHFFVCNAAIGGNEPEPEPEPDPTPDPEPEPDPTPDPDQPGDIVVPDGHILLNTCEYITEISGILRQYRFATNDGNNIFYVFVKKDTTHGVSYIETKTYSNASMNDTAGTMNSSMNKFNMDCTYGSSISDTKIDGVGYANGISTNSSYTMEVISATENGIHEIVFNVKSKAYYFYGTIQQ